MYLTCPDHALNFSSVKLGVTLEIKKFFPQLSQPVILVYLRH